MMLTSFLRWLYPHPRSRRRPMPKRRGGVGRLEILEDRTVPSIFTVSNLADSGGGSLRQAILDANSQAGADTIVFDQQVTGTIALTSGQLTVTDSVLIAGPGADRLAVSGGGNSRIFSVLGSVDVTIGGLTAADGFVFSQDVAPGLVLGGGLLNLGGYVTLRQVQFSNNTALAPSLGVLAIGGAVANVGAGSSLTVDRGAFI